MCFVFIQFYYAFIHSVHNIQRKKQESFVDAQLVCVLKQVSSISLQDLFCMLDHYCSKY